MFGVVTFLSSTPNGIRQVWGVLGPTWGCFISVLYECRALPLRWCLVCLRAAFIPEAFYCVSFCALGATVVCNYLWAPWASYTAHSPQGAPVPAPGGSANVQAWYSPQHACWGGKANISLGSMLWGSGGNQSSTGLDLASASDAPCSSPQTANHDAPAPWAPPCFSFPGLELTLSLCSTLSCDCLSPSHCGSFIRNLAVWFFWSLE